MKEEADRDPGAFALASLSDDALLRRLVDLTARARHAETELVTHLGEVDARRLYLREACPSMFAYCTERLHFSSAEAYLRIAAARATRRHPVLLEMLGDGRMHLIGIARLAPHLTAANRDAVLARAAHGSRRQIDELVAELSPRPDVRSTMRKLPTPWSGERAGGCESATATGSLQPPPGELVLAQVPRASSALPGGAASVGEREGVATASLDGNGLRPDGVVGVRSGRRSTVEPTAPGRYKVQFAASVGLRDKLDRLQRLMRHVVPDGDLAAIIEVAVTEKLQRLEARGYAAAAAVGAATSPTRGGAAHQQLRPLTEAVGAGRQVSGDQRPAVARGGRHSRHIPAAIRRAVWLRDGGQCRYVSKSGERCGARERVEFHHRYPFGHGFGHSIENLSLLCRAHNGYLAALDYGSAMTMPGNGALQSANAAERRPFDLADVRQLGPPSAGKSGIGDGRSGPPA